MEKAGIFGRLPTGIRLPLVPQRPLYRNFGERVDHGVVDEGVGVEFVVVVDVVLHPTDVEGGLWSPSLNPRASGCGSD